MTDLPPLPLGKLMGSATINGKRIELRMHDDEAMRAYATAAISAQAVEVEALRDELRLCCELKREYQEQVASKVDEVEALRADAERYRWLRDGSNPPWVMQMLERYADNGSDFDAEVDAARAPQQAAAAKAAGLWPAMSHNPEAFEAFAAAIEAAERERCARVCELRGRALEAARAHAEGSLQGANPKYWGPLLSLAAELAESIRRA